MQNQPKTVKTFKRRNPATRVGLKSLKDDLGTTYSTHQANVHQNMMNSPQNEDIAAKSSFKTPSNTNFEQQIPLLEHNISSYERVQEQLESTLNGVLSKDKFFKSSSSDYLTSILVDRIHVGPGLMSQILELKASKLFKI